MNELINDVFKALKYIEIKKTGEDDSSITYIIYYNSSKVGILTISKEYANVVKKIQQFIELIK